MTHVQNCSSNNPEQFDFDIAADAAGTIYLVSDGVDRVVQIRGRDASLVQLVGTDTIISPTSVAVDHAGNLFVTDVGRADTGGAYVAKITVP